MNFAPVVISEVVAAFEREVDDFLDQHLTSEVLRHEIATGDGFHAAFHQALGAKRWIAPRWSPVEGGLGLDVIRARVLLDRLWARQAPDILRVTTMLIADSLRPWAEPQLLSWFLPGVASGDIRVCQGITEPDSGSDAASAKTSARFIDGTWHVNGSKMFTSHAHNSTHCYLLVRTEPDVPKHEGLTILMVPLNAPGILIRPIQTVGHERTNFVFFTDVSVADGLRIGPRGEGWRVLNTQLDAEHGLGADLDVPLKYVIQSQLRRLYATLFRWAEQTSDGGRPRLDEPYVRARLGSLATDIELLRSCPLELSRALASDVLIEQTDRCLDLLGSEGLLSYPNTESTTGGLPEFRYRSAQATAVYSGSTDIFRNILARRILGLPRLPGQA